jgi:hypothetical protein
MLNDKYDIAREEEALSCSSPEIKEQDGVWLPSKGPLERFTSYHEE